MKLKMYVMLLFKNSKNRKKYLKCCFISMENVIKIFSITFIGFEIMSVVC